MFLPQIYTKSKYGGWENKNKSYWGRCTCCRMRTRSTWRLLWNIREGRKIWGIRLIWRGIMLSKMWEITINHLIDLNMLVMFLLIMFLLIMFHPISPHCPTIRLALACSPSSNSKTPSSRSMSPSSNSTKKIKMAKYPDRQCNNIYTHISTKNMDLKYQHHLYIDSYHREC